MDCVESRIAKPNNEGCNPLCMSGSRLAGSSGVALLVELDVSNMMCENKLNERAVNFTDHMRAITLITD